MIDQKHKKKTQRIGTKGNKISEENNVKKVSKKIRKYIEKEINA